MFAAAINEWAGEGALARASQVVDLVSLMLSWNFRMRRLG
jgi:hypothetical protein